MKVKSMETVEGTRRHPNRKVSLWKELCSCHLAPLLAHPLRGGLGGSELCVLRVTLVMRFPTLPHF